MVQVPDPWFAALGERLRDEYDALGMMSYTGGQPDMCVPDIEAVRDLIREAGSALRAAARMVAAAEDLPLWRLDADISDGEFDAVTRFRRSLLLVERAEAENSQREAKERSDQAWADRYAEAGLTQDERDFSERSRAANSENPSTPASRGVEGGDVL